MVLKRPHDRNERSPDERLKIFGWLLFKDRLNCKSNLFHKNIGDDAACPHCDAPCEDVVHIFLQCPQAVQVWMALGLSTPHFTDLIWDVHTLVDNDLWNSVAISILWKIWDSRNTHASRNEIRIVATTIRSIGEHFTLWICRIKSAFKKDAHGDYTSSRGLMQFCKLAYGHPFWVIFRWDPLPPPPPRLFCQSE